MRFLKADALKYRSDFLDYYEVKFKDQIAAVIKTFGSIHFENKLLNDAHKSELRYGLIFRHSIPFLATEDDLFGGSSKDSEIVLCGCLAAHTLALTHLDYHLDGASPRKESSSTALKLDAETAVSYAVRMIYKAGAILAESSVSKRIWTDCIDPISGFVMSRMYLDWKERYSDECLMPDPKRRISLYENDKNSRIQASGYWETMIRAAYIVHSKEPFPDALLEYCKHIRRLRQLVDELQDIDEDISSGLVTLPVLYLMEDNVDGTRQLVSDIWQGARKENPDTSAVNTLIYKLKNEFSNSDAKDRYFGRIYDEYDRLATICETNQYNNLRRIADFKLAKFAILQDDYSAKR